MDAPSSPAPLVPSDTENAASDERLLAGLVRGDPGAKGAFVRRFQSRVYGLATAIVGDGPRAEGIAEEALIRACHRARTYDSRRGPVISWVLGITRQLAIETRGRHPAGPAHGTAAKRSKRSEICLDQLGPGPEAAPSVSQRTTATRRALSQLPVEQRRAVVLAAIYGCTAQEVSEAEAVPLDAAQAHVRSGLIMMRALLRPPGP